MDNLIKRRMRLWVAAIAILAVCAVNATPINVTAQLTGDSRTTNPNDLVVDVTIATDTTSNSATWTVDINSPAHSGIKLDEFYFNMAGAASDYRFSEYTPSVWEVSSPGSGTGGGFGGGQTVFLFEAKDVATGNDKVNVDNDTNLVFTMTLTSTSGLFTESLFTSADVELGAAGTGQLGAHLQALTVNADTCPTACSTSGFALGDYATPGGGTGATIRTIPEPGTTALLGLAIAALACVRRRGSTDFYVRDGGRTG